MLVPDRTLVDDVDWRHILAVVGRVQRGAPVEHGVFDAEPDERTCDDLDAYGFAAGSMALKVEAAQDFAPATGKRAIVCALADLPAAVDGEKGATIGVDLGEIACYLGPALR